MHLSAEIRNRRVRHKYGLCIESLRALLIIYEASVLFLIKEYLLWIRKFQIRIFICMHLG